MTGGVFSTSVKLQTIRRGDGSAQHFMNIPSRLVAGLGLAGGEKLRMEATPDGCLRVSPAGAGAGMDGEHAYVADVWRAWGILKPAFNTEAEWRSAGIAAMGDVLGTGRHTLAGALEAVGLTGVDWNRYYRIHSMGRVDIGKCERLLLDAFIKELPDDFPVLLIIDDTQLRKSGRRIPYAKWLADKLGPKFNVNLIWGLRFIQISIAIPSADGGCRCHPVAFFLCPPSGGGRKGRGAEGGADAGHSGKARPALPQVALERLSRLVRHVVATTGRKVVVDGDGGYTTKAFCRGVAGLQADYLGRCRKDARLFAVPSPEEARRGRIRYYGKALPAPQEICRDASVPYREVAMELNGENHVYRVKETRVRSAIFGNRDLRLVMVAPVYYRKGKVEGHREPLFLLTTDLEATVAELLKYYVWRWEIELNFKDEKSLFGIREPQNWKPAALKSRTPLLALTYSLFLFASTRHFGDANPIVNLPAWRKKKKPRRCTVAGYRELFRKAALHIAEKTGNKSGFDGSATPVPNLFLCLEAVLDSLPHTA